MFRIYCVKQNALLKLISPAYFLLLLQETLHIWLAFVIYVMFLLGSAGLNQVIETFSEIEKKVSE